MEWATVTDVADWVGVAADNRMTQATAAANTWCQRTRPDLPTDTPPPTDVKQAVILYAALLYRERTSPQGFATYLEQGGPEGMDASAAMVNVYRLLGSRKPVAR
jgi:hypothetical protein